MAKELEGKVAAVTGGASGIGLASSEAMLAAGARVVLVDRDEAALMALSEKHGDAVIPLVIDLLDAKSCATLMSQILEKAGQLDILHANAGIYVGGDLVDSNTDAIDRMLNLNVNVVMKNVHDVLPHMIERGTGDIVVTSSLAAHFPTPWEPVYASSKWAINCFVQTVRRQVFRHGIRVGSISPGPVISALLADWPEEKLKEAKESGSLLEASEVANVVMFIVYADPLYHAFEDPATSAFVGGVAAACDQRGLGLLLLQGGGASLRTVQSAAVDGLIIYSLSKDAETIRTIADRGLPMVVVDQPLLPKVPFVGIDDRAAARSCGQHLKDLGHQNIAIVTFQLGNDKHCGPIDRKRLKEICFEVPRRRIEGYLEVLDASGPGFSVMIWECSHSNEESGRTAAEGIFESEPRPSAILATSDRLAIGVIEAAVDHQLRVPQDLAVVG